MTHTNKRYTGDTTFYRSIKNNATYIKGEKTMKKALSITENRFCAGVGIQANFDKMMHDVFGKNNHRKHNRCQHNNEVTSHILPQVFVNCRFDMAY